MTDQQPQQPAGWYPDQQQPGQQRYWDGQQWTSQTAPAAPQGYPAQQAAYPPAPPKKGGAAKVIIPIVVCLGLGFLLLVGGLIAASGGDDDGDEAGPTAGPASESSPDEEVHAVGDTGMSGDFEITVNTVEDPWTPDNEFETPPTGQRFIGVEMTLVNTGDSTTTFSTLIGVEVVDSEGRAWNVALTTSAEPQIDGAVPAGATRRGWVYLAVGEDASGLEMRVKGNITATGTLFRID